MADLYLYVDGTNNPTNHQFVSLDAALDHAVADHSDLSVVDGIIKIPISITTADTLAATVSGFTNVTASRYIDIYTTGAARNTGGAWSNSCYRLTRSTTYSRALTITTPYTRVTGLQIAVTATTNGYNPVIFGSGATNCLLDSCRIYSAGTTAVDSANVATGTSSGATATIRNCVLWGSQSSYGAVYVVTGTTITLQNCTIYVPNAGYCLYKSGTINAYNCYLGGPTDTIYGTLNVSSKVATSDGSGSEAGLQNIAAAVDSGAWFTVVASDTSADFRIQSSSALKNVGADLSGTFTHDITGATRDASFDIGAFEFFETAQYARPTSVVAAGNWDGFVNGVDQNDSANLDNYIDETSPDDTDSIRSTTSPSDDTATIGLSSISTPSAGTVTMRVRARFL